MIMNDVYMGFSELNQLISDDYGLICIFGAGKRGRGTTYDFVINLGLRVDYYVDNSVASGTIIRDGISCISPSELLKKSSKSLVFISVLGDSCYEIYNQLKLLGIKNIIIHDGKLISDICLSLTTSASEETKQKYGFLLDDTFFLEQYYRYGTGKNLNITQPILFNEKLQYLKIHDRNPIYTTMVDKFLVKNYVSDIIGEEYLFDTLGVWDRFEDINIEALPNQFVLKCTHDSGSIVIVKDKSQINYDDIKRKLNYALSINYYWGGSHEWPYKNVQPRILAEPYMTDDSGIELKDYKLFCFGGQVKLIQVDYDRFTSHKRNLYNTEWERQAFTFGFPTDDNREIDKPDELEEMISLAELLSKDIPHVRVDFYIINHHIYFGEFTFYHGGGCEKFTPEIWDTTFGNWIDLSLSYDVCERRHK